MSETKSLLLNQDELWKLANKSLINYGKCSKAKKTISYIETRSETLESLWCKFKENHYRIVSLTDKSMQADLSYFTEDRYEQFEEIYVDYKSKMRDDIKAISHSSPTVTPTTAVSNTCEVKLPQINLPRFQGGYEEWQTFHDLFVSLIHNNTALGAVQKLHYLKSCLHGEAEYVLKNISTTEINYNEAWLLLIRRYDNKRFNTNEVLKRLFAQKSITTESATSIKQLLDTTSACLKSLTNLKIDTSSWDAIINYVVVSKLDPESRKQWEVQLSQTDSEELPTWEQLKRFMETRFRTMEMLEGVKSTSKHKSFHTSLESDGKSSFVCILCNGQHALYQCKQFSKKSTEERSEYVQKQRLCFNCLSPTHPVKSCHQSTSCRRCGRRHHSLLHMDKRDNQGFTKPETRDSQSHTQPQEETSILSNFSKDFSPCEVLLATAVVKAKSVNGSSHVIRALVDPGSQASFITEETVQMLGLKRTPVNGMVSGVGDGHTRVKYAVVLRVESRHHLGKSISVYAYVLSSLTSMLPSKVLNSPNWLELEKLPLADPEFTSPSKIDILLGAEVYGDILRSGVVKNSSSNLIAQNTAFGWIISGKVASNPTAGTASRAISLHAQISTDDILKQFWELEKEPDNNEKILTTEEIKCEEIFNSTTTRQEDGRFMVRLPFNSNDPKCQYGRTMEIARNRFTLLERKFEKNPKLHEDYVKVMEEYKTLNHMRLVPKDEVDNPSAVYLPHHAVVREDKDTSKVRVVFDASCRGVNNVSLNENLMIGPKLQQDLHHLLIRWRTHRICIIADLVKMYRQVRVDERDINYQRILWRASPDQPLEHYQLLTLTFGTACAPYLAVKVLHKLAEIEELHHPVAAQIVRTDLYMDDLMTGCENEKEAVHIFEELNKLMKLGGFQFQKWSSNSTNFLDYIGQDHKRENESILIKLDKTIKTLGLMWNRPDDAFEYVIKLPPLITPVTKRQVVSDIARLFDPLGLVAPVITTAKVFIQKLWLSGIEWDQELPEHLLREWLKYRMELPTLSEYSIPRWLQSSTTAKRIELQGFCDASNMAYAAVVFMRVIDAQDQIHVHLVCSKTKVAPVKQVSIPRLELCGAVLLAKLLKELSRLLEVPKECVHAWTDSTVVLAWLSDHPSRWKTFVGNRVSEILTVMDSSQWSHVRSQDNPADCASRGLTPTELIDLDIWKTGPRWLREESIIYTKQDVKKTTLEEKKSETVCLTTGITEKNESEEFINRFSSLGKLLRVGSYCRRWLNLRKSREEREKFPEFITAKEMKDTLYKLIKVVQSENFSEEIEHLKTSEGVLKRSPLHTLCPILDLDGILRVSGRLDKAELSYDQKRPIILPSKSHLTSLVIADAHIKTLHGGPQIMMSYLRCKYFIVRARVQVKKYFRSCVTCRRYSSAGRTQLMGQIPEARLKPSKPFKSSGVDYAGPINIRFSPGRGSKAYKGYICLFVCMVTRAIHLEAVSDLTAKGFIAAFRRFTSRRGQCSDLYSDNGTNFVGANKQLMTMLRNAQTSWPNEIVQLLTLEPTTWHFIPPHSPNFGGLWEAGVRSVKNHLKKVIGDSTLTFEELSTVLTQIEACLNSRPISILSDNPCDPLPLTPGHFLVGEPLLNIADQNYCDNITGLDRWRMCQKLVNHFWKRWSKEYIVNLNQRYKWNQKLNEPNINDIVLIRDDNLPPAKWLLGKIVNKHPGPDSIARVVSLKTKNGIIKRPISKICIITKDYV